MPARARGQTIAVEDNYCVGRKLFANVDFYSGIIYA
jgi:citrate synthase